MLLDAPYKAITDQMTMENLIRGGREDQLFVNSTIGETVKSFKLSNPNTHEINYRQSLKSFDLLLEDFKVINTTYNQVLTKSASELAHLDYIFIDESHALANDISFRSEVITALIEHLTEFICKKPSPKPFNPDMNEVYQSLKKNSKLFKNSESISPRTSSGGRGMLNDPNYAKKVFIVLNKDHEILYANFSKSASCRFLCDYAYTHEGFKLKNGITPVKSKKGIYNPETYRTSFYNKKEPSRAINNYSIIELDVYIARYLEYLKTN